LVWGVSRLVGRGDGELGEEVTGSRVGHFGRAFLGEVNGEGYMGESRRVEVLFAESYLLEDLYRKRILQASIFFSRNVIIFHCDDEVCIKAGLHTSKESRKLCCDV
jgi:hypothetical protein